MAERLGSYEIPEGTPRENYEGIYAVDIPEFGEPYRGKVADNWDLPDGRRVIVRTDRKSAFDRKVGSIAGIGASLNLLSAWWFDLTRGIMPNHLIAVPHPNAMVVKKAAKTSPIEWVFRRYMFQTTSKTSVYLPYSKGVRHIYGQDFPDGLRPNEAFPKETGRNGVVFTPTTKAESDVPITSEQAKQIFDSQFGKGKFDNTLDACYRIYNFAENVCTEAGLILIDTKMEVGVDEDGIIMLIDELLSQDASRYGRRATYQARFEAGKELDIYDKELLRKWLAKQSFNSDTPQVPVLTEEIKSQMRGAYIIPFRALTGKDVDRGAQTPEAIREAVLQHLQTA